MNDPVADRQYSIFHAARRENLTIEEATAKVDAAIADEEAIAKAYYRLFEALRENRAA